MKKIIVGFMLMVFCVSCQTQVTQNKKQEAPLNKDPYLVELEKTEPMYQALNNIVKNFPHMETAQAKKCAQKPKWMGTIYWGSLVDKIGIEKNEVEKKMGEVGVLIDLGRFTWVPKKQKIKPENFSLSNFETARKDFNARSHTAVFRPMAYTSGQMNEEGSEYWQAKLMGWYVIFNNQTQKPECQWPIEVTNSNKIEYAHEVGAEASDVKSKADYALLKDIKENLKDKLSQAKDKMMLKTE